MNGLLWAAVASSLLSGFFALAVYSLRDFRRGRLEAAFGSRGARRLALLETHWKALRLTAAFCRSVANLCLIVAVIYLFDATGRGVGRIVAAMATAWAVLAILGEAIPHAWAYASGERVLASTLEALLVVRYALWPIVAVMRAFEVPIRRLSGVSDEEEPSDEDARREILAAASEGRAEGAVEPEEVRMIESVITFGRRQAGEIMTPRTSMVALPADIAWREALERIQQSGHTRIPLYEDDLDHIVGILYVKDLLGHLGSGDPGDLRRLMRKCYFVPETKRLDDLLREFKARKVHAAIVLDEYGGTAGLVSFEDVLEEIVGDIRDEYDRPAPALMKRVDDRTAEVNGRMYVVDLNKAMGLSLPEEADYDTVAGLVVAELGYIPSAGETLDAHGARFEVLAADERRITRVRVRRLPRPTAES